VEQHHRRPAAGFHRASGRQRQCDGGWIDYLDFDPGKTQICLSVGRLIHDDDCVKVLAGSAMLVGDEDLHISGIIEIPARCVVSIVRLEEKKP
jgi:hypothetical protein